MNKDMKKDQKTKKKAMIEVLQPRYHVIEWDGKFYFEKEEEK